MTQQVDWNWQISNKPAGFTSWGGINPTNGPYGPGVLYFDDAQGFDTSSSSSEGLRLASLTQQGVIGTHGGQQLQGTFWITGQPGASAPVSTGGDYVSLVVQDGYLGFWGSDESNVGYVPCYMGQAAGGGATPKFFLTMPYDALIRGCYLIPGNMHISANDERSWLDMDYATSTTTLADDYTIVLKAGIDPVLTLSYSLFGIGRCDLSGNYPYTAFSLFNGALVGQYAGLYDGSIFSGGILTSAGGIPAIAGDVTGDLGTSELTSIQGNPVLAPSPSIGDALTWNGTDWIPAAGGGGGIAIGSPVSGGTPGDTLQVDGSGNLGQWIPWQILQAGASVVCDSAGGVTAATAGVTALYSDSAGAVTVGSSHAVLSLPTAGTFSATDGTGNTLVLGGSGNTYLAGIGTPGTYAYLANGSANWYVAANTDAGLFGSSSGSIVFSGGIARLLDSASQGVEGVPGLGAYLYTSGGAYVLVDSAGNVSLNPGTGLGIGVFGQAPHAQYAPVPYSSGFVPNTSANPVFNESTWTGGTGSSAYTIDDIVNAMKVYGWFAL